MSAKIVKYGENYKIWLEVKPLPRPTRTGARLRPMLAAIGFKVFFCAELYEKNKTMTVERMAGSTKTEASSGLNKS